MLCVISILNPFQRKKLLIYLLGALDGNCYVIVENSDSYEFDMREARGTCRQLGMLLPEIRTLCEWKQLERLLPGNIERFWLGFGDIRTEGTFKYFSDNTEITFTDWLNGQPNEATTTGSDCVSNWNSGQGWNDFPCTRADGADAIICLEKKTPCSCNNDNSICKSK